MPFHTLRTFRVTGRWRPHPPTRGRAAFGVAAAALLWAAGAAPGQVVFTKITDTSSGPFSSFGTPSSPNSQAPSLSGSVVAFLANSSGGGHGIVTAPSGGGPLVVVTNFFLPNGLPIGGFLSQPATDGSVVAFVAADIGGRPGVYTAPVTGSGPLARMADTTTPAPNGSGNFQSFFNEEPSISGSVVAFTSAPSPGIYTGPATGGALARVADANTPVQPSAGSPSLSGAVVAFAGFPSGGGSGIYTGPAAGGALTPVADTTNAIPNGSGNFFSFGQTPAVSGSAVAFVGSGSGGQAGVYAGTVGGGPLARVADATTAIPGGSGTFTGFSVVDVSGPAVTFVGTGSGGQSGVYFEAAAGGALTKLLAVGDTLDGKIVSALYFNDGLEGSNVAFTAAFTDGSQGVYVGHVSPVPEPAGLSAVGAGLVGLLGWRRGRRGRSRTVPGSPPAAERVVDR